MSKWKEMILEENMFNPDEKYQIYCDLDGVLVDWTKGVVRLINEERTRVRKNIKYYQSLEPDRRNKDYLSYKFSLKIAEEIGWDGPTKEKHLSKEDTRLNKITRNMSYMLIGHNLDFWKNLDWAPGGSELWKFIEPHKPIILSSPLRDDSASEIGKRIWCKTHLGLNSDRVIIVVNKGINIDSKVGILIDDKATKLAEFKGIGILHKTGNIARTIDKLHDLGYK